MCGVEQVRRCVCVCLVSCTSVSVCLCVCVVLARCVYVCVSYTECRVAVDLLDRVCDVGQVHLFLCVCVCVWCSTGPSMFVCGTRNAE